ncbi:hypothetical protein P7K49_009279 [Saguinus oedipus]|uniref:Uncharacterized protein n=1 Tax=Saguinus oedipus TaxID=9490 RepID=A0ABQ9VJI8_SAGOE|nr:hypothetical protein P7K49_009279 [Saguinus oedipus]
MYLKFGQISGKENGGKDELWGETSGILANLKTGRETGSSLFRYRLGTHEGITILQVRSFSSETLSFSPRHVVRSVAGPQLCIRKSEHRNDFSDQTPQGASGQSRKLTRNTGGSLTVNGGSDSGDVLTGSPASTVGLRELRPCEN